MKKVSYLLLLLLGFLFAACSDGKDEWKDPDNPGGSYFLSGSVVMNGEPVNAAAVLLTPGGGTYLTGSDGFFTFEDIDGGPYEIKVYKEGCQPFNKSLTINKNYRDMALTITENKGNLHLNKGYIDMGSNASNNVAAFTITNKGNSELTWQATSGARWITKIEPANGTIPVDGSVAVSFTINRDRFSQTALDNHTAIVVRSTTTGDGSLGELLVTAFGQGNGTNTENDNSDLDYVMVGDLYVQTVDISASGIDYSSAERLCRNSIKGGYADWRLPTLDELATMYENRVAIGGFEKSYYWSSDVSGSNSEILDFENGGSGFFYIYNKCRARAVRKDPVDHLPVVKTLDITTSANSVILNGRIEDEGLPKYTERGFIVSAQPVPTFTNGIKYVVDGQATSEFKYVLDEIQYGKTYYYLAYASNSLGTVYGEPKSFNVQHSLYVYIPELKLMVQRQDLGRTNYDGYSSAVSLCEQSRLGGFSDWRLPTIDELVAINSCLKSYPLTFNDSYSYSSGYWSSTVSSGSSHYVFNFYYGGTRINSDQSYSYYVRAVRTVSE